MQLLLEIPHASGCCFTIGGPDGRVVVIEASGGSAPVMLLPPKPGNYTSHANHPIENDDVDTQQQNQMVDEGVEDTNSLGSVKPRGWDSSARLERMEEYLAAELAPLRGNFELLLQKIKDALVRAVAFSPALEDMRTFGLAVLICDAEQPSLELSTSEFEPFVVHKFSKSK